MYICTYVALWTDNRCAGDSLICRVFCCDAFVRALVLILVPRTCTTRKGWLASQCTNF